MTSLVVLDLLTRYWICLTRLGISDQFGGTGFTD